MEKKQYINLDELIEEGVETLYLTFPATFEPKTSGFCEGDFIGNRMTIKFEKTGYEIPEDLIETLKK